MNLYEVKIQSTTALIYARSKKIAKAKMKELCAPLLFTELSREDWEDEYGIEVTHMGCGSKDWTFLKEDESVVYSFNFVYES